jgi:hypothetical protein
MYMSLSYEGPAYLSVYSFHYTAASMKRNQPGKDRCIQKEGMIILYPERITGSFVLVSHRARNLPCFGFSGPAAIGLASLERNTSYPDSRDAQIIFRPGKFAVRKIELISATSCT